MSIVSGPGRSSSRTSRRGRDRAARRGSSSAPSSETTSRQSREVCMTFTLSTDVSRPPRSARDLEAAPGDPLDLRPRVLARVEPGSVVARALGAEVEPADELAHDHHVDPRSARRPQIRVDAELLAEPEQPLLGPNGLALELGQADGGEQDGVGLAAGRERLGGERVPWARIALPPNACSECPIPSASSTRIASAATSGPIPSPGKDGDVRHADRAVAPAVTPMRSVRVLVSPSTRRPACWQRERADVVEAVRGCAVARRASRRSVERAAPCRRASSPSAPRGRRRSRSRGRGRRTPSAPSPAPRAARRARCRSEPRSSGRCLRTTAR